MNFNGVSFDSLTGNLGETTSNFIEGDTILLNFVADESGSGWGFAVDRVEYLLD